MSDYAEGATSSLNATITAVMKHLNDDGWRPGPQDGGFREFLYEKIGDLAEKAYKNGFKRGHGESAKRYQTDGEFPEVLKYKARRKLAPKATRTVKCRSTIKAV